MATEAKGVRDFPRTEGGNYLIENCKVSYPMKLEDIITLNCFRSNKHVRSYSNFSKDFSTVKEMESLVLSVAYLYDTININSCDSN
jgi:hypothetical protein